MKQKRLFLHAGILALILIFASVVSWEIYLRHSGRGISYDDGGSLWSNKRKKVYEPIDRATVFIGSSRIKYDLDVNTWQNMTGEQVIQLANVGSSPRPVLEDLANDPHFKGKVVIDVTEFLFFSPAAYVNQTPEQNISYFKKETPAQKFSFLVNRLLESNLVLLDKEEYSLNGLLADHNRFNDRPGVYNPPNFLADFTPVTFERQSYMTERLVKDPKMVKQVTDVWQMLGKTAASMPPLTSEIVDSIMTSVKTACDEIKARGGKVIFVRTPSSGPLWELESQAFPKDIFWNKLLTITECDGVYFKDYEELAHFQCPEFSHLSLPQAVSFTKSFVGILQEKGWFPSHYNTIAVTH